VATITKHKGLRGTSYKVRIRKPNSPTVTKTFSSKSFAEKWARQTELKIEEGTYFEEAEAASHTVSDLVDRYLRDELQKLAESDWQIRKRHLNWWKAQIGTKTLNRVSPALLVEQRNKLKTEPNDRGQTRSGSTVNRYMAALSAAFGVAVSEWQWVKENPFSRVRREAEAKGRVRFLSTDERTALLYACKASQNKNLHLITVLALSTGMRQAEIMTLTWDQVDFDRRAITLLKTKNGDVRVVPLVGLAADLLRQHGKVRSLKNPYVFPGRSPRGQPPAHAKFPRKSWETAINKAEIEDFHFHDCRHSAASELAMNGASLHEIAAVLGHRTLAMVQRYAHLSEQHTTSVVERMNNAVFGVRE
jgi:integrase